MKLNHYIFFRSARHSLWFCNSVRMTLWIASSLKMFEMGAIFYRTDQVITDLNVHFDCVFAIQMAAITNNGSNREIHLWTVNSPFGRLRIYIDNCFQGNNQDLENMTRNIGIDLIKWMVIHRLLVSQMIQIIQRVS